MHVQILDTICMKDVIPKLKLDYISFFKKRVLKMQKLYVNDMLYYLQRNELRYFIDITYAVEVDVYISYDSRI